MPASPIATHLAHRHESGIDFCKCWGMEDKYGDFINVQCRKIPQNVKVSLLGSINVCSLMMISLSH